jgi:hypothetical protein
VPVELRILEDKRDRDPERPEKQRLGWVMQRSGQGGGFEDETGCDGADKEAEEDDVDDEEYFANGEEA